jgi:hypothetical protein
MLLEQVGQAAWVGEIVETELIPVPDDFERWLQL